MDSAVSDAVATPTNGKTVITEAERARRAKIAENQALLRQSLAPELDNLRKAATAAGVGDAVCVVLFFNVILSARMSRCTVPIH
jgi:hypothetical protein